MGTWGEGLYDDDEACDVRDTIALLSKMPASGDEILDILLGLFERNTHLDDDGSPTFWMTVGDQFSKRGIHSDTANKLAHQAILTGVDLIDLKAREMNPKGLKARRKVHEKLLTRLDNPKPPSKRRIAKNLPRLAVEAGEIYSYPTENGQGMNAWFSNWEQARFKPDGWGSLIIVATGRVFEWFPWAAFTPLTTSPLTEPSFDDAISAKTILIDGVGHIAPKSSHMKKMKMTLLGKVELSAEKVDELRCKSFSSPKKAVLHDSSICGGAFSTSHPEIGKIRVSELIK